jgi:GR25 family glycosyltransferase involved in LPS biosynthesis
MINAYVIRIKGNELSERAARRLYDSAPNNVKIIEFDAMTPDDIMCQVTWNYPWSGEDFDYKSGLIKRAYPTENPKARIACFLSHYTLWQKCVEEGPLIVHEHDAIYFDENIPLPLEKLEKSRYDIIGLNDPRGATRLAQVYNNVTQESPGDIVRAPKIDDDLVPQGIAGNSSYYIKPSGAEKMIKLTEEYGAWPNDALMCRQLVSSLGQTKKYYTYVQGLRSTTST